MDLNDTNSALPASSGSETNMTPRTAGWLRFLTVAALLAGAALFLRSRGKAEILPPRQPLELFPLQVGAWQGREVVIPQWALEILGAGEFLERSYFRAPEEPAIDLFVAYFPSQRMGTSIHSPQNCLPGSGWTPVESTRLEFDRPRRGRVQVNRYVLSKGLDRLLVFYWYQSHGRVVASEYWAKFYLVADAIRMNRSDGALVRLSTPLGNGETADSGQQRLVEFRQQLDPLLTSIIPL
jgi:EpsI family protein